VGWEGYACVCVSSVCVNVCVCVRAILKSQLVAKSTMGNTVELTFSGFSGGGVGGGGSEGSPVGRRAGLHDDPRRAALPQVLQHTATLCNILQKTVTDV